MATYYATPIDSTEVIATTNGNVPWTKFAKMVEELLDAQGRSQGFDIYHQETGKLVCSYLYLPLK